MELRWSPASAADLAQIVHYISEDSPSAASRVASMVYARAEGLTTFPLMGRAGRREGTRELVLAPLPFIVVYRVFADAVEIVRIVHAAQRWPRD